MLTLMVTLLCVVRIMAPLTTLWIYSLATGEGYTAVVLRGDFLVNTLGPNSYNCFLFHQMVGQWYSAATRGEVSGTEDNNLNYWRIFSIDKIQNRLAQYTCLIVVPCFIVLRNPQFWNWWAFRKSFYWFSPGPCPIEWYEYFFVVSLVVAFSHFMDNTFTPGLKSIGGMFMGLFKGEEEEEDVGEFELNSMLLFLPLSI